MLCEPGARLQAVVTTEIVRDHENVPSWIVGFNGLEPLNVVLRVARGGAARPRAPAPAGVVDVGGIRLDLLRREATVGERTVGLSAREFSLLKAFGDHPGEVLSRQELLSMAWGVDFDPRTNLVDVYVGYLRRKLGEPVIETVRGVGYRLGLAAG